jgi:hypothetical protein
MAGERQQPTRDLELRAIEQRFAAEWRTGNKPQLSAYLERYPHYAAALTDFAAALLAGEAGDETPDTAAAAPSPGTLRALDTVFGEERTERSAWPAQTGMVAEWGASYVVGAETVGGLLALASTRGVSLPALTTAADLPSEALALLDGKGAPPDEPPAALLARLSAALGVGPARVAVALRRGGETDSGPNAPVSAPSRSLPRSRSRSYRDLIMTHPALTPVQRERWLALLMDVADEG